MITLLQGHSLTAAGCFKPEKMQLNLTERGSTATMTVGPSAPELAVGDWLRDENGPGAGTVWRVKTVDTQYDSDTRTVTLEHMITSLKDRILFGEVKPSDISGGSTATAEQTVEYILERQDDWELGEFDYGVSNPYNFNGDDLLSAIETVSSSLEGCWWSYDFSTYPFKLNIQHRSSAVGTELRMSRNIQTAKMTIDRSRMYTRLYPIGKNNLHLDGNYVSRNEETYGVICKVETDQSKSSKAELQRWAEEKIRNHCEPAVTVTVNALDLSAETGEDLDRIVLGAVCRMPLPGYDTVIEETVTKISWPDKIAEPDRATVTLANIQEDVASIVNNLIKGGGGGGRASALNAEEDHAWFVDTTDHVSMIAEAVAGKDGEGNPDWSRVAELTVSGNGIDARVTQAEGDIVTNTAAIEMTQSSISLTVAAAESQMYTYVDQTASGIHTEIVSSSSGLYAYIDQTASYFRQTYISKTNKTWIQDTDPRGSGETPKAGDIWVESTHQGTWDGAEGFDWEHDEDYDWTQVQGAKVWGWQNDKWELVSDQQQVVSMTDVEETAEHIIQRAIRLMTNDDGNLSAYRAELIVEGNRIRSEVNELISDVGSSVEQTASAIRSEVHAAQSDLYSFILQTASQITIRVGESNRVFSGLDEPTGTEDHPLVDGDLWLETNFQRTWTDLEELDAWIDDEDVDWSDLKGSKVHVYDGTTGAFREVLDEQVLAQDTDIDETSEKVSLVARSVRQVNGKLDVLRAEVKVKSDAISSTVEQKVAQLGSSITQTASQIRAEVTDRANGLSSSITQQADRISLVVEGTGSNAHIKPAQIVQAINNGASTIKISADHITLDGDAVAESLWAKDLQAASLDTTGDINGSDITGEDITAYGKLYGSSLGVGDYDSTWKSYTARRITLSTNRYTFPDSGGVGHYMYAVTGYTDTTLYYLGR